MNQANSPNTLKIDEVFEALRNPLSLLKDSQRREEMLRFLEATRVQQERAIYDLRSDWRISGIVVA